jgi:hypothetical protein
VTFRLDHDLDLSCAVSLMPVSEKTGQSSTGFKLEMKSARLLPGAFSSKAVYCAATVKVIVTELVSGLAPPVVPLSVTV